MLIFNCTKAACEFFYVTRKGQKVTPVVAPPSKLFTDDPQHLIDANGHKPELMQWLVHAIKVQRKHVLVVMELNSRYSMLFADLRKGDVAGFVEIFHERILNNMQWYGESIEAMDEKSFPLMASTWMAIHPSHRFFHRGDRSVQAHINDVVWHFKRQAADVGHLPDNQMEAANFDEFTNQLWRQIQFSDQLYPYQRMLCYWLENICATAKADIEIMLEELADRDRFVLQNLLTDDAFGEVTDFEKFGTQCVDMMTNKDNEVLPSFNEPRPIPDNVISLFGKK